MPPCGSGGSGSASGSASCSVRYSTANGRISSIRARRTWIGPPVLPASLIRCSLPVGWSAWRADPFLCPPTAPSPCSPGDQDLAWPVVHPLDAIIGDEDDVLDAHPEPARQVDAGFDRERHTGRDRGGVARHDVGILVDVDADAVAGAVDEVLPVAGVGDHLAGSPIDLGGDGARPHGLDGRILGRLEYSV